MSSEEKEETAVVGSGSLQERKSDKGGKRNPVNQSISHLDLDFNCFPPPAASAPSHQKISRHLETLIEQSSRFMDRANVAGDVDAWTVHFLIFLSLLAARWNLPWPGPEVER